MSSASDDSTDEEYKPQDEDSDIPSEAETDYDSDGNKIDKIKKRRKKQLTKGQKRPHIPEIKEKDADVENTDLDEDNEEEKQKSDALWTSFLNDTNSSTDVKTKKENEQEQTETVLSKESIAETKSTEKFITKVFDFAGEEVKVTEKVKELKSQDSTSSNSNASIKPRFKFGPQRSSSSGGLGSVLGQLGKKGKISTLEKTKLDWMAYKKDEGIEEELQTHNKGKDGYLERQDFLERTDLRQFERERDLRQSKRSNR